MNTKLRITKRGIIARDFIVGVALMSALILGTGALETFL